MADAAPASPAVILAFCARPDASAGTARTRRSMPKYAALSQGVGSCSCRRIVAMGIHGGRRAGAGHRARSVSAQHVPRRYQEVFSRSRRPARSPSRAIAARRRYPRRSALLEFFYMPLMHSEHLADQLRCIELFRGSWQYREREIRRGSCRYHQSLWALSASQSHPWANDNAGRAGFSRRRRIFGLMTER